jgi:hypothetical protein
VIVAASRIQSQLLPMAPPTESNSHSAGQNGKPRMYLTDAAQDLLSQAGRIIPDLRTIQELGQTAFHGGLVDDRKYLVCSCSSTKAMLLTKTDREYYPDHGLPAEYIWIARENHGCVCQHSMGQPGASSSVLSRGSIQISDCGWKL